MRAAFSSGLFALRRYYQAAPAVFVALAAMSVALAVFSPIRLMFQRAIVDSFATGKTTQTAVALSGFFIVILCSGILSNLTRIFGDLLSDLCTMSTADEISRVLDKVETMEFYHSPDYLNSLHAIQYLGATMSSSAKGLINGVLALITIFSVLAVTWFVDPLVPAVLLATLFPEALLQKHTAHLKYTGLINTASEQRKIGYMRRLIFNEENVRELRFLGALPYLRNMYSSLMEVVLSRQRKVYGKQAWTNFALATTSLAGVAAAMAIGLLKLEKGFLTVGTFVMLFSAVGELSGALSTLMTYYGLLLDNAVHIKALKQLMASAEAHARSGTVRAPEPGSSIPLTVNSPGPTGSTGSTGFVGSIDCIEARHLSFGYPGMSEPVIKDINLTLKRGETVALVGVNGAGKTTLSKLLLGMYRPWSGTVLVNGRPIEEYDRDSVRARMACLFQDFGKFYLTIRDNVAIAAPGSDDDRILHALDRAGARNIVDREKDGLSSQLGKRFGGTELSGGEWQKLALARALIRDPDFIVLDEPSSALDALAEYELYVKFKDIARNKICLLISHRFTTVSLADRIVVLQDGRIVEEGTHQDLMALGGIYARMYHLQTDRYREGADVTDEGSSRS